MPNSETVTRSRRRRRRSSSDDDGPVSGWKMGLVVGVVVLCFGMLYPSLFHPMISSFFSKPPPQQTVPNRPPIHPSMSSPRARPDIHPGMRMAAAQAEATTASSSKGMFAWMLPLYTVGVVVFLIYTLVKSKKKKQRRRHAYSSDESDSCDDDDEYEQRGPGVHNLGRRKLRSLQERLKQTELAMSKILEQLGTISVEATQGAVPQNSLDSTVDEKSKTNEENKKSVADKEHYLLDLEKALREFKHLSNSYNKAERKRRGESVSEEEGNDDDEYEEEIDEDEGIEERAHDGRGSAGSAAEDEAENGSKDERKEGQEDSEKNGEEEVSEPTAEPRVQQSKPHKRSKRT